MLWGDAYSVLRILRYIGLTSQTRSDLSCAEQIYSLGSARRSQRSHLPGGHGAGPAHDTRGPHTTHGARPHVIKA